MANKKPNIRALTLHQARAWQIMHGDKRVENRSWRPNKSFIGQRIAIHAGTNKGHRDVQNWVRARHRTAPKDKWPTGIMGTVKITGILHKDARGRVTYEGENTLSSRLRAHAAARSVHFAGPYGWVMDDPEPLKVPVPHEGRLQLWTPDKWEYSSRDERPPASLMARMIGRVAAEETKAGTGSFSAG